MVGKLAKTLLLVLILSFFPLGMTCAEGLRSPEKTRVIGEVQEIDPAAASFIIKTRSDLNICILVTDLTAFRGRGDWMHGLGDLELGMKALVIGSEKGEKIIEAHTIGVAIERDLADIWRSAGEIVEVNADEETFTKQVS